MVMGYFSPGEGEQFTFEDLERRKKLAAALMSQAGDYSPVQSWTQGAARLASGLVGGLQREYANKLSKEGGKAYNEQLAKILSGGQSGGAMPAAAPSPMPTSGSSLPAMASGGNIPKMVMPDPVYGNLDATQKALLNAIAAPESAGAYNIRYTPKGGATFAGFDAHPGVFEPGPAGPSSAAGRYQFTKTTWDRMGGGAFTPENQDQRALALANQDYKARTGRDLMADIRANGFTPQIAQALGPTWRGLIDNPQKAMAAFQSTMQRNQPAQAQVASAGGMTPDGMPTSPVPSNTPPMSYAPGQQAIASAAPQAPPQPAQGQRLAQAITSPPIPAPQPTGNVQAAMMAVLTDPRFSPQQKQQAMELFQMGQREQPKWEKLNDGTLYNPRTAETRGVGGGYRPITDPAERARFGIPAEDKAPYYIGPDGKPSSLGRAQTNVNVASGEREEDKIVGRAVGERRVKVENAFSSVPDRVQKIELAQSLLEGVQTGRMAGFQGTIAEWALGAGIRPDTLEAFGINPKLPATQQALESEVNRMVVGMIGPGGFPANNFSDADRAFLVRIFPSILNRPEANALILDVQKRAAERELMAAEDWAAAKDAGVSFAKWERDFSQKVKGQDVFKDIAERVKGMGKAPALATSPQGNSAPVRRRYDAQGNLQ